MRLIKSHRYSETDLERWAITERSAELRCASKAFQSRVRRAGDALLSFATTGECYAGVSWGKDSVVLASLVSSLCPRIPLVWIRVEPIANPDCCLVRDAFLRQHRRVEYHEIEIWCKWFDGDWHATGTLEEGFSEAARRFGRRHISGIRGEESGQRKRRMKTFGESSINTCAPIGNWHCDDVWAYTHQRGLPVHPAYACTMDGLLDPSRIRVASLGGKRGTGMGRAEWEARYYAQELAAMRKVGD